MKAFFLCCIVCCGFFVSGCQKELSGDVAAVQQRTVKITFQPVVEDQPLASGDEYTNAFGEHFSVTALRFYVAYPSLKNNNAVLQLTNEKKYRLVDAGLANTLSFTVTTTDSVFNHLSFQVGVDSLDNVSGAQSGDLDPGKGMFWTWNSGYVMAKLEGVSSSSSVPEGNFSYHIGGFSGLNNAIRQINLSTSATQVIKAGNVTDIIIHADISKWFNGVNLLRISDNAFVHSPGELAKKYADNYASMFSVSEIVSE